MHSVLISGANRGIGLEFARQYAAEGWHVYATARNPEEAAGLIDLGDRVSLIGLMSPTSARSTLSRAPWARRRSTC